jgi:hypothetical protein
MQFKEVMLSASEEPKAEEKQVESNMPESADIVDS